MNSTQIEKIAKNYQLYSLWIVVAMALVVLIASSVLNLDTVLAVPLVISSIFSLIMVVAFAITWKLIALKSYVNLTKFYLVAPALRMLLATLVILVYCVFAKQEEIIYSFIAVFCMFYVVMLIFDCIYFARVEKRKSIHTIL